VTEHLLLVDDIDDTFVPRTRAGICGVVIDGETVLLDEHTSAMHTLNQTATVVWGCFDGRGSIGDIVADLADVYPVDGETVRRDVLELARVLGRQGLLDGVAPEPPEGPTAAHDHQQAGASDHGGA